MEIIFIFFLIFMNGILAMMEMAIVSSSRAKLKKMIGEGNRKAQKVLELSQDPNQFLSTIQIGITLVGVITGVFGGAAWAGDLDIILQKVFPEAISYYLAFFIVVLLTTYLSLVLGEIVPKRLGMFRPEKIACFLIKPMLFLSRVSRFLVKILSFSTNLVLKILQIKVDEEILVSQEEVKLLVKEGAQTGVFEREEKDIFERTLKLGDKKVNDIMTSRNEIAWFDINESWKKIKKTISDDPYSYFPICEGSLDRVVGVLRTEDLLKKDYWGKEKFDLEKILHKPLFVPETIEALKVIELFRKTGIHMVMVVDEYGNVQGLISINDILDDLLGDVPEIEEMEERDITKRDDGSFLVDGMVSIDKFKEYFKLKDLPGEEKDDYNTIGGFVMYMLDRIPWSGDSFKLDNLIFEVMDMDGNRVDKVLVKKEGKREG